MHSKPSQCRPDQQRLPTRPKTHHDGTTRDVQGYLDKSKPRTSNLNVIPTNGKGRGSSWLPEREGMRSNPGRAEHGYPTDITESWSRANPPGALSMTFEGILVCDGRLT